LALPARDVGLLYGTLALGATVAPLFVGLLADRLFATQRVLAVLHSIGAILLIAAAHTCEKHRDEVAFAFDKLALAEPAGDVELWRLLWEKDSLEHYLANPAGYRQPPPALPPHIERAFRWLGITLRRPLRLDYPPDWGTTDAGRQRLSELDRLIRPALGRVLASA